MVSSVFLLVKHTLGARVNRVYVDAWGGLIVVYIAVKCGSFGLIVVYALNEQTDRGSFFRQLRPFLDSI